ncbi:MAG: type II secretion system minor pseudopilin [Planctomycetota bacterium]|jgi:type II secretory pathway component PulK
MNRGVNKKRRGLVIIAVLWTVVVLMAIVAVLGRRTRLDMKVCMSRLDAVRCKWACRAGVEKAVAVLNTDETENDTLLDLWSDNDEDFNDVMLDRCVLQIKVTDEASKLDINAATKDQLMGLPYMLEEIADAIIDWRDTDDMPSGLGVESGYYEGLDFIYRARNGPFRTIRELLMVNGVTEELFYGEDTNLNGLLDYNERDGDETPPADDGDDELDLGWIAYLTCYTSEASTGQGGQNQNNQNQNNQNTQDQNSQDQNSQNQDSQNQGNQNQNNQNQGNQNNNAQAGAKVNVNTASEQVLAALLGGWEDENAVRTALDIIDFRESSENGIESPSDLTDYGIMTSADFANIEDYITVSSDVFTVVCVAATNRNGTPGAQVRTEVVLDRSSRPYKVLFSYEGASN